MRCAKAGISCQGYEKATLWVNRTPDRLGVTALSVIADTRLQHRQHEQHSQSSSPYLKNVQILHHLRNQLSQPCYDAPNFRSQALYVLQSIYLPQPDVAAGDDDNDSDPTPSQWVRAVCQMTGSSSGLDYALLAFCAVQVRLSGESGESGISHDETVQVYNSALGKVIADLNSQLARGSDETLAAIVVLSTCEVRPPSLRCLNSSLSNAPPSEIK